METELWPNMLWILKERNIPSFIANGRISDRTWLRLSGKITRPIGAAIYGLFTELFMREERDRQRLISIGVNQEKICVPGDTKIDALLGRRDYRAVNEWKEKFAALQGRYLWPAVLTPVKRMKFSKHTLSYVLQCHLRG